MQPSRPNRNGHPISTAFRFQSWSEVSHAKADGTRPSAIVHDMNAVDHDRRASTAPVPWRSLITRPDRTKWCWKRCRSAAPKRTHTASSRLGKATSKLLARINIGRLLCVLALGLAEAPGVLEARPCESLLKLASPTVSITGAIAVETGTFTPAGSPDALSHLPRFCRVSVQLSPTADSDIGAEIWLPASRWNGK